MIAGIAQSVEQLIRNQQVVCSSHIASSSKSPVFMIEYRALLFLWTACLELYSFIFPFSCVRLPAIIKKKAGGMLKMVRYSLIFALLSASFLIVFFFSVNPFPYRLRNCVSLALTAAFATLAAATAVSSSLDEIIYVFLAFAMLLLLVVALCLIGSGTAMLVREAERGQKARTLLLGLLLAGVDLLAFALLRKGVVSPDANLTVFLIGSAALIYGALLVFSFLLYLLILPCFSRAGSFDAILVHGCALIHGDQVSRILAARLDTAIHLYRYGEEKARIVVSGGRGDDEDITEAEAMRGYLRKKGIPEDRIIPEDRSHSTQENLLMSMELLPVADRSRIALVTSDYHLFRCLLQAHELGIYCQGFGAPVAAYYWPNAAIREFAAVFSRKRYLGLSLLSYFAFTGLLIGAYYFLIL